MNWHHGYQALVFAAFLLMTGTHSAYAAGPGEKTAGEVRRIEIKIPNHNVVRDSVIKVVQGDAVELVWTTDKAASLHLHGYDIELEIPPNTPAVMVFTAYATGRFPITNHQLHKHQRYADHKTLIYLEVYPK
jgi:hypothetical protein